MVITATATQMKKNFGKYLSIVMEGNEVIITKNGREVGKLIPKSATVSYVDSLTGILKENVSIEEGREERIRKKYEIEERR